MPAFGLNSPRQGKPSPVLRRILFVASLLASSAANAQVKMPPGYPGKPPWADTARESNIYPVGDAVGVYTAVLDLYFIDGTERPPIIVMHDTAEGRSGGPCPMQCSEVWLHKSTIDSSTMLAFAKLSPKRPKMVPFGYPVPIKFLSYEQANLLRAEGAKVLEAQHRTTSGTGEELVVALNKDFPGVWGFIYLSKVGFNDKHTEALVSVHFFCGIACSSDENLFLKKVGQRWVVIERIPNDAEGLQPWVGMRYRGPAGSHPGESDLVAVAQPTRTEGGDAAEVYETVLDSLYRFYGESPRRIVLTDWFPVDGGDDSLAHNHSIEASTLARYRFLRGVRAPLYTKLKARAPVSVLPRDSFPEMEKLGKPLATYAEAHPILMETSPFWLEFRRHFSGAWGMVGFTRAAFNDDRTQALVFTSHSCGESCRNGDTWLVERKAGGAWRVSERIPRSSDNHWGLDSLRYLGTDADPRTYRNRRIRAVFVSRQTGTPLAGVRIIKHLGLDSIFVRADSEGRYEFSDLPVMGGLMIAVPCQGQPMLSGPPVRYSSRSLSYTLISHPGIDSTATIPVDLRRCVLGRRAQPLVAGKPTPQALASGYPDATDAAVYRGVLDELYHSQKGPVLLLPYAHRLWKYDFDAELARLRRQGVVDSTMTPRLAMLPEDSAWLRPNVSYGHRVVILGQAEQRFLEEQASDFGEMDVQRDLSLTGMAKEAYPGADKILSFSRIAYNQALTQAIVQIGVGRPEPWYASETMILHKVGNRWRVVRRHVEKEETAGDMIAGRCEPVDAVQSAPSLTQLERFVGEAEITFVIGSSDFAGRHTARLRFIPNDTLHRYYWLPFFKGDKRPPKRLQGQQHLAKVEALDSSNKVISPRGELEFTPAGSAIIFAGSPNLPEGVIEFDGPYEEFKILRVNGRQFFGSWHFQTGPTYPTKGYFCGRLR